jgi:C-terminal processing protease CtpA/Prc
MINGPIRRSLLVFLTAVSSIVACGTLLAQQQMKSGDLDVVRGILRDARDAVKKNYYDPKYHGVDLDARYQQYDDRIKSSKSIGDGFRMVAAFLDGLKDSHTYFNPPDRANQQDYGFRMQLVGETAYIVRTRPGTDAESKVHAGDLVAHYMGYSVNRSDFNPLSMTFNMLMPQPAIQLDLADPDGKPRQVVVVAKIKQGHKVMDFTNGTDIWQYVRAEENEDHVVRQRYVEIGDVIIWKMPEFVLEDSEVDHMFGIARKHQTLILDLRSNPGGYTDTLERMVGNLFDHDVKISDRIGRKEMKPQVAKTVGVHAFTGKVIVLLDSNSASAAELFARVMQLEQRGTVIGDRSSGSVMEAREYAYQQGIDTVIPYGFSVTDADLIMKDGKSLEHAGVVPDELVLPTARDLASGNDPALARAAELAGLTLDPAAAGKMFPFEWIPF